MWEDEHKDANDNGKLIDNSLPEFLLDRIPEEWLARLFPNAREGNGIQEHQ